MDIRVNTRMEQALNGKELVVNLGGADWYTKFKADRRYSNGRLCVELIDATDGSPFATLTVNIPTAELGDWEILVKTWSENEMVAKAALASGRFKDTGKRINTGFVQAQVWEVL